ncbi:NAD(P)H-dependent oxidoreductase [Latilactobacillus fragifolii]|uniref:NAD(P)H-dependent oxidoreductase n=1 Tax=Latilactobacillus fragifolii TaxID=2814244 RepID=UPI001ABB34AB|nr:NAD(P)H-dependent oxidoreductase [Latilactobacillus fragifolii]
MKTLVIISHPEIETSMVQNFLKASAAPLEDITWHHLDAIDTFDVVAEQTLLRHHERIIFQFPLYWYAAPASLKAWLDTVLTGQFAFNGRQPLAGKTLGIVVSTGTAAKHFQAGGSEQVTLSEILRPYELVARKLGMVYLPPLTIHQLGYWQETDKQRLVIDYQRYLTQAQFNFDQKLAWFETMLIKKAAEVTSPEAQQRITLLREQLANKHAALTDLNWQVQLIREEEGEG